MQIIRIFADDNCLLSVQYDGNDINKDFLFEQGIIDDKGVVELLEF